MSGIDQRRAHLRRRIADLEGHIAALWACALGGYCCIEDKHESNLRDAAEILARAKAELEKLG